MSQPNPTISLDNRIAWRYLQHALGGTTDVPWRIAARLQKTGLFSFKPDTNATPLAEALKLREAVSKQTPSPLVLIAKEPRPPSEVFELVDVLGSLYLEDAQSMGLKLATLVSRTTSAPRIHALLERYRTAVNQGVMSDVMSLAAELSHALEFDWEWQIETLSAAVTYNTVDIINRQIERLMSLDPSEQSFLDFLSRRFNEALETVTSRSAAIPSGADLISMARACAHLPWKPGVGLSYLIEANSNNAEQLASCWRIAEQWLSDQSPGLWFHAWMSAVRTPAAPPSIKAVAWNRMKTLFEPAANGQQDALLNRYRALAKFFFYRIEAALPNVRPDLTVWCSSYLGLTLATALDGTHTDGDDNDFRESISIAQRAWQVGGHLAPYSSIRTAALSFEDIWQAAVQASVTYWPEKSNSLIPSDAQPALVEIIRKAAVLVFETGQTDVASVNENILERLTSLRIEWSSVLDDESVREYIAVNQKFVAAYENPDVVSKRMAEPFGAEEDFEGLIAIRVWASMLARGQISIDSAVDLICSTKWSDFVEPTLGQRDMEALLTGFLATNWGQGRESVRVELPHWAARQCIKLIDHEDRRRLYYWMTAFYCLHGGTVSAMYRLEQEEARNNLAEERKKLRLFLTATIASAPAWIQGKIRSLFAVMSE